MVWHACEYGATVVRRVSAYLFLIVHICLTGRMHDGVVVGVGVYLVRHVVPQVFSSTSYRYLPPKYLAQTARTLDEPYLRNVIPTGSSYITDY